jgi:hypothetical protein
MRLKWIAFERDVPSPSSTSIERGHWLNAFTSDAYDIERDGDDVRITSNGTGQTFIYPWARVAGSMALATNDDVKDPDEGTFVRQVQRKGKYK